VKLVSPEAARDPKRGFPGGDLWYFDGQAQARKAALLIERGTYGRPADESLLELRPVESTLSEEEHRELTERALEVSRKSIEEVQAFLVDPEAQARLRFHVDRLRAAVDQGWQDSAVGQLLHEARRALPDLEWYILLAGVGADRADRCLAAEVKDRKHNAK
jgi:hypothetical protein